MTLRTWESTNARDNVTNGEYGSATLDKYIALAKQGIRFDFVVENSDDTPAKIDARPKLASAVEAAVPGSVRTIEGWNEVTNFGGSSTARPARPGRRPRRPTSTRPREGRPDPVGGRHRLLHRLHAWIHGPEQDARLCGPGQPAPVPQRAGAGLLPTAFDGTGQRDQSGQGLFVYTETGYSTAPGGVTDRKKATNTLDLLLDATKDGSAATYLYEELDAYAPGTPNGNSNYGLFGYAGRCIVGRIDTTKAPAGHPRHGQWNGP